MYVCMYVSIYLCMYVCMHACMHACCMYVCTPIYIFMCVCARVSRGSQVPSEKAVPAPCHYEKQLMHRAILERDRETEQCVFYKGCVREPTNARQTSKLLQRPRIGGIPQSRHKN